jgi:hypothetical protein
MAALLLVPVRLDALVVQTPERVVGALADFSRLPYTSGGVQHNADVPFLSSSCTLPPLATPALTLAPGIHLHWSLPEVLTRSAVANGASGFPALPNRWLVTRSGGGPLAQWVVESDYLHPAGQPLTPGEPPVTYPVFPTPPGAPPFRHLGRQWSTTGAPPPMGDRIDRLTAAGYGDPTFGSLYGNCARVFGALDAGTMPSAGLQYDLVGWYDTPGDSPLAQLLATLAATSPSADAAAVAQAIQQRFGWSVGPGAGTPTQMLCYARLVFTSDQVPNNPALASTNTTLAIGNTGGEAVSAWLAGTVAQAIPGVGSAPADVAMIEEQLEALRMLPSLAHLTIDSGAKFLEARHDQGFSAESGGTVWTVRPSGAPPATGAAGEEDDTVTLPGPLAAALNELNTRQLAYDRATSTLGALRRRLYSAWGVSLEYAATAAPSAAPAPTVVRDWLATTLLPQVAAQARLAGVLAVQRTGSGEVSGASPTTDDGSLAAAVASELRAVLAAVAAHNAGVQDPAARYTTQPVGAPRYWVPNNPVVALIGDAASAPEEPSGVLPCLVATLPAMPGGGTRPDQGAIDQAIRDATTAAASPAGVRTWSVQPWNPLLLEWEVMLEPLDPGNGSAYLPSAVTQSFTLGGGSPELAVTPGAHPALSAPATYSGRSLLTGGARDVLLDRLRQYVQQEVLPAYFTAKAIPVTQQGAQDFETNLTGAIAWQAAMRVSGAAMPTPEHTALVAYRALSDAPVLSQALSGFNEGLLTRSVGLQLPVADPLAADQAFVSAVAQAVGSATVTGAAPLQRFVPLRSGRLTLSRLRVVDSFGQVKELVAPTLPGTVRAAAGLVPPAGAGHAWLPPRLPQPTRLSLRWLSAADGTVEMNSHPATTPICGWLLPNLLDEALMVYDSAGTALGAISVVAERPWQPAPGGRGVPDPMLIDNPHLAQMVSHLVAQASGAGGSAVLSTFLQTLDGALGAIDPATFAQHTSLQMLVSRPVALVRVQVGVELNGPPAQSQACPDLFARVANGPADPTAFDAVDFPVRVGAGTQYGDGVAGYWVEDASGGYATAEFQQVASPPPAAGGGAPPAAGASVPPPASVPAADLRLSPAAPPVTLAMLVDPRGKVHAASGILPVKAIDIPADQFAEALRSLSVTFLTAPLLSGSEHPSLPLPAIPGYGWDFLEAAGGALWRTFVDVTPRDDGGAPGAPEIRDGWLRLTPEPDQ